jgi:hypothetical protein
MRSAKGSRVSAQVEYVCVTREHYEEGLAKPLGSGHITRYENAWAYCAAGKPEEQHIWHKVGGLGLQDIRHDIDWTKRNEPGRGGSER